MKDIDAMVDRQALSAANYVGVTEISLRVPLLPL